MPQTCKYTQRDIEMILELTQQGMTIRQVAKIIGRSPKTIYNWGLSIPELVPMINAEKKRLQEERLTQARKSLDELLKKHKVKTITKTYDADKNIIGIKEEIKELPPSEKAAMYIIDRYDPVEKQDTSDTIPSINIYFGDDENED